MAVNLSPILNWQQLDANGLLLSGGMIETYLAGSSTPATTYKNSTGTVAHPFSIPLNTRGEPDALIYLTSGISYKFIRKDSLGNVVGAPLDNVIGVNDPTALSSGEWVFSGLTPTFISATSFSLASDQTQIFHIGRRLKCAVSTGDAYSSISNSVFAAGVTTITVNNDFGYSLDIGLSSVSYGVISAVHSSAPITTNGAEYVVAGGTSAAYTITPSSAAYTAGLTWKVNFTAVNVANATIKANALIPLNLKIYTDEGVLVNVAAGTCLGISDVTVLPDLISALVVSPQGSPENIVTLSTDDTTLTRTQVLSSTVKVTIGGGTPSATMPLIASFYEGDNFDIVSHVTGFVISKNGTEVLNNAGTSVASITLNIGDRCQFVYTGGQWMATPTRLPVAVTGSVGYFQSSQQTIALAALLTIPHGLGSAAVDLSGYLVCQTAEQNWAVNDTFFVNLAPDGNSASIVGCVAWTDATNVFIKFASGNTFPLINKTTGAGTTFITPANWKLVVRAWI
jgi:hypothetical protein